MRRTTESAASRTPVDEEDQRAFSASLLRRASRTGSQAAPCTNEPWSSSAASWWPPKLSEASTGMNPRSEERREGKSVDLGGRRIIQKKRKTQRDTTQRVHERTCKNRSVRHK